MIRCRLRKYDTLYVRAALFCNLLILPLSFVYAQNPSDSVSPGVRPTQTVIAGKEYGRSSLHQKLWGKHYRKEWVQPVVVPHLLLPGAAGGLKPYQAGGGRQSKTLRLRTTAGSEYVLRSINKSFGKALPAIYQNTFVENIINDQVSIAHPYAAATVWPMAGAAKIHHTIPQIFYVPQQEALDSFNKDYGNNLYLLEQRPDGDWEGADNFGNSANVIGTARMMEHVFEDNDRRVDQLAYVRARLFDIFIGDWGRHEDQWRWASFEKEGKIIYQPIPRDRDQVYTKFDGFLLKILLSAADLGYLETFDHSIKNVSAYNFTARNLDRAFANEPQLNQWVDIAKELQQSLTDSLIEASVKQMPAEVFPVSGPEIIAKLKSRRDHLAEYAAEYYKFLAKEADVPGTEKNELFEIKHLSREETNISIYKISKDSGRLLPALYSRTFNAEETKEIRLYGIGGKDVYTIDGTNNKIKLRIIGGAGMDSITNASTGGKVHFYDDHSNVISQSSRIKKHLANDSSIHLYQYDRFVYDDKGFKPSILYSYEDRLYGGLGYKITKQKWRREPFGYQHAVYAHYSITQGAPNFIYQGTVNQFIGKWNLALFANYDVVRWTNFFGLGNETEELGDDRDFYRMRSRDVLASIGLNRKIGKWMDVSIAPFFQSIKIIEDEERFVPKYFVGDKQLFRQKNYAGLGLTYSITRLDNSFLPTRGVSFSAGLTHIQNLTQAGKQVTRYGGQVDFYLPVSSRLVVASRIGGATLTGEPEFYQLNSIGGSQSLRGYRRDRFWGENSVYNTNELQWLFDFKSHLFNGKAGLIGIYDIGRVWLENEHSDTWHSGYGGGILLAPFNKIGASVIYGISKDGGRFHLRFRRGL